MRGLNPVFNHLFHVPGVGVAHTRRHVELYSQEAPLVELRHIAAPPAPLFNQQLRARAMNFSQVGYPADAEGFPAEFIWREAKPRGNRLRQRLRVFSTPDLGRPRRSSTRDSPAGEGVKWPGG